MSPQFRSLILKEWSERRRLFWSGLAMLIYFLGYCIAYEFEYRTRTFIAAFYTSCELFGWLGAILLSMTAATGEYSKRTLRFSASLPVPLSKVAWARLLATWGCLVIPMLIGAILATLLLGSGLIEQAGIRAPDYVADAARVSLPDRPSISHLSAIAFLWTTVSIAVCSVIYLSTLMSLLGTWCRREGTVGFLGVIVILVMMQFTTVRSSLNNQGHAFLADWVGSVLPESMVINWGYGEQDGSHYTDLDVAPLVVAPLGLNLLLSLGLACWFASRYGCRTESLALSKPRRRWLPRRPRLLLWPIRWPGRIGALVWLDARQSVPLCLAGLVIAAMMTGVSLRESYAYNSVNARFAHQLPENTLEIGLLWGAIVAVGVFGAEVKPGLEHFWRSRPIEPRAWFWTKFLVGLAALLIALDLLPALGLYYVGHQPEPGSGYLAIGLRSTILCMPVLHAQSYAFTVAAICLLRRSIPAAIVAILLYFGSDQFLESMPVFPKISTTYVLNELNQAEELQEPLNLIKSGYPLAYGAAALMTLIAVLLARKTIVPSTAVRVGGVILLLVGLGATARADETAESVAQDLIRGLDAREKAIQDFHLNLATNIHHTGTESLTNKRRGRKGTGNSVGQPRDERFDYEYYQKGSKRAWTVKDSKGAVKSSHTYDGTIRCEYKQHGDSYVGKFEKPPQLQFPHPYGLLLEELQLATSSMTLQETIKSGPLESIVRSEAGCEQFIEFTITHPAGRREIYAVGGLQTVDFMGHRLQMTVNASRNYWPVKINVERLADEAGRVSERYETNATGWVESGSIVFPKSIVQSVFRPKVNDDGSWTKDAEFVETLVKTCEVKEFSANTGLSDDHFASPFPPGVGYYDMDERRQFEVDESGTIKPHIPQPKGTRGMVFGYLLITVIAAVFVLYRRPAMLRMAR